MCKDETLETDGESDVGGTGNVLDLKVHKFLGFETNPFDDVGNFLGR